MFVGVFMVAVTVIVVAGGVAAVVEVAVCVVAAIAMIVHGCPVTVMPLLWLLLLLLLVVVMATMERRQPCVGTRARFGAVALHCGGLLFNFAHRCCAF